MKAKIIFLWKKLLSVERDYIFVWILQFLLIYLVSHHAFFWDTVQLGAWHADFYYENNFQAFWLPNVMDSGHPPFFGIFLAIVWKLLGKSLAVSHWAMLPFLWGISYQLHRLGRLLAPQQTAYLSFLAIINPVLLAQSTLISPDVVLIFCFLWALNALLNHKSLILMWACVCLSMVSMRGMMCVCLLFIFDFFSKEDTFRIKIRPYLPSGIFALLFLIGHYLAKGWVGYFAGSSWAEAFQKTDAQGFFKNIVVISWRLVDFGYLWCWLCLWWHLARYRKQLNNVQQHFVGFLILSILVLTPTALIYNNLSAHRYFLPIYLLLHLTSILMIQSQPYFKKLYFILSLGLLTGHTWVYPQPIATCWDATLAHLPYYALRKDMIRFIQAQNIDYQSIGSAFPNVQAFRYIDLQPLSPHIAFAQKDFKKNSYILYSNVFNDFTEQELNLLKNNQLWEVVYRLKKGQIEMILYKKNETF